MTFSMEFAARKDRCVKGTSSEFHAKQIEDDFFLPTVVLNKSVDDPLRIRSLRLIAKGATTISFQKALDRWSDDWSQRNASFPCEFPEKFNVKLTANEVGSTFDCELDCEVEFATDDGDAKPDNQLIRRISTRIVFEHITSTSPGIIGRLRKRFSGRGGTKRVTVEPPVLPLKVNKEAVTLTISCPLKTSDENDVPQPKLLLSAEDDESLDATLRHCLEEALNRGLIQIETPEKDMQAWEMRLQVNLAPKDESRLWPTNEAPPISVSLKAVVEGFETETATLQVVPGTEYSGWIAIDFGTSHSTATLFDAHIVHPLDGLPKEQFYRLRDYFLARFNDGSICPEVIESPLKDRLLDEWKELLMQVGHQMSDTQGDAVGKIRDVFDRSDNKKQSEVHAVLRRIQLALPAASAELQQVASLWLHRLFEHAFRAPPMEVLKLFPVEVSPEAQTDLDRTEILSEAEVVSTKPHLRVKLGKEARDNRLHAEMEKSNDSRFFPALKRRVGQHLQETIEINGEPIVVSVEDLVREAWRFLLNRADEYRHKNPQLLSPGRISRAIITYPTVAPPQYRHEIRELARKLGLHDVTIDYDEAISAAIFYLMRDYDLGGSLSIGLEAFKGRSVPVQKERPTVWNQNILVLDIGGGTTDLALIRLTLRQDDPLADENHSGAHGYYYVLTPRLLGSTGHMHVGGQLITLQVFRLLKFLIAESVLSVLPESSIPACCPRTEPFFRSGQFQPSTLLNCLSTDSQNHSQAASVVESVLPTWWALLSHQRWSGPVSLKNRDIFNRLWRHAEDAKILLGRRLMPGETAAVHTIESDEVARMLADSAASLNLPPDADLTVRLDRTLFEKYASPVIEDAIKLAKGLLDSRLPTGESLDWLILSGKTCNLELVERQVRSAFADSPYFTWNNDRVTFDPEFAKLATSVGACYAEHYRKLAFDKEGAIRLLRQGIDQLEFNIKNLFFFLPCSFMRLIRQAGDVPTIEIFRAGTEFLQLDHEPVGKTRSEWGDHKASLQMTIHRQDYPGAIQPEWGTLISEPLLREIEINEAEWRSLDVQYEVNHLLDLRVYLCRGLAHFLVVPDGTGINLKKFKGPLLETTNHRTGDSETARITLKCDIAMSVNQPGAFHAGTEQVLFAAGTVLERRFHTQHGDKESVAGIVSSRLTGGFHHDGSAWIYVREPKGDWSFVDKLSRPRERDFPCPLHLTFDERGNLQLHSGEVPYWQAGTAREMWDSPGAVFMQDLDRVPSDVDLRKDPFSGIH